MFMQYIYDGTGFVVAAAVLFLLAFLVRNMLPLRVLALLASLCVIAGGYFSSNMLITGFGALAALANLYRFFQVQNTSRRIRRTRHYGYELDALLPLMSKVEYANGQTIFVKGDPADRLYVLVSGDVAIVEHNVRVEKGALFGEFGLFTGSGTRTSSAKCLSDVELRTMTSTEVDKLYFNQPEFGYALVKLMATRMSENIEKLQSQLKQR